MKRILAVLLLLLVLGCAKQSETAPVTYFGISDPGITLEGVTALELSISKVSIHNQGTDAWQDVLTTPVSVDLLKLKTEDVTLLLAQANLPKGTYNQVRLDVSKVMVTVDGKTEEAKLPSTVLKINVDLKVTNESSVVNFDFLANESLHRTGEGKIIMAPVLNVEVYEGANVEKQGKNIEVKFSRQKKAEKVGMDENGDIGKGVKITEELQVDQAGKVKPVSTPPAATGKVIFTVKDKNENKTPDKNISKQNRTEKPVKTTGGLEVESLLVTIGNLSVHKTEGDSWVTIPLTPKTFDLIDLQGVEAVLSEANLGVGQYTQIRFDITKVEGMINNQTVDITLPSKTLKLVGVIKIKENSTSAVTLDFLVAKSVHKAGDKYLLKPVIKLVTRTDVKVKSRERIKDREEVEFEGGETVEDTEIAT